MNFRILREYKSIKIFLVAAIIVGFVYVLLRITIFSSDPVIPLFNYLFEKYLYSIEWIANLIFQQHGTGILIEDHEFLLEVKTRYHLSQEKFVENWPKYLLFKKWSAVMLLLILGTFSIIRKKILFFFLFIVTHFLSVLLALYFLGYLGPLLFDNNPTSFLTPNMVGVLPIYIFFVIWVLYNKNEIRNTFQKMRINFYLSDRKMHEILLLLFFFLLLNMVFIPFLASPYGIFLLEISRGIAFLLGHDGYIVDDQLIGASGALALNKGCLGLNTMYLFAALVFLTRPAKNQLYIWPFMVSGLLLLFFSNVARLVMVFVVAQGENGFERASRHHEIYNVGIYLVVFFMWVFWIELMRRKELSRDDI